MKITLVFVVMIILILALTKQRYSQPKIQQEIESESSSQSEEEVEKPDKTQTIQIKSDKSVAKQTEAKIVILDQFIINMNQKTFMLVFEYGQQHNTQLNHIDNEKLGKDQKQQQFINQVATQLTRNQNTLQITFDQLKFILKEAQQCDVLVNLEIDIYDFSISKMICLFSLLKLIKIEEIDSHLFILINDNKQSINLRNDGNKLPNANISWLWSHVGMYLMNIGYDIQCVNQFSSIPQHQKAIYVCNGLIEFSFDSHGILIQKEHEKPDFKINFSKDDLSKNDMQNYQSLIKQIIMLAMMRQGVYYQYANPLAQILPIFFSTQYQCKNYDEYLEAIKQLKTNNKLLDNIKNICFEENILLIPFHFAKANVVLQPLVSLLVEQSGAYKLLNFVMNFVYHRKTKLDAQKDDQKFPQDENKMLINTNYILSDGSRSGKTTSDLALYYFYMFQQWNLQMTPVLVSNMNMVNVQNQPLARFHNVDIRNESVQLNINYKKEIKALTSQSSQVQLAKLIHMNIQDFINYPSHLNEIANQINDSLKIQKLIQCFIHVKLNNGKNDSDFNEKFQEQYKEYDLKTILGPMCQLIKSIQQGVEIDTCIELQNFMAKFEQQHDDIFANFFAFNNDCLEILKDLKEPITKLIPSQSIIIVDEVCIRDPNSDPQSSHYALQYQLIQQVLQYRSKQKQLKKQIQKYTQFKFINKEQSAQCLPQLQKYMVEMSKRDLATQILSSFPLSLFLKQKSKDYKQLVSRLNAYPNINDSQKMWKSLQELSSTQGFEAVMYRDIPAYIQQLQYVQTQQNKKMYVLSQQCILEILNYKLNADSDEKDYPNYIDYLNNCKVDQVFMIFSGTNCSLNNFVRFAPMIMQTSSSRYCTQRYVYSCPLTQAQYHPCLLNNWYYKYGSTTLSYKKFEPSSNVSNDRIVIDFLLMCNATSTSYIQTINPLVTPQILIRNKNKNIIYGKTHDTFQLLLNNYYLINVVDQNSMNKQVTIFKEKEISTSKSVEKFGIVHSSFSQTEELSSKATFDMINYKNNIIIQPLSQANIAYLAEATHYYIDLLQNILIKVANKQINFEEYILNKQNASQDLISNLSIFLIENINMIGGLSDLCEILSVLLLMNLLKSGQRTNIVKTLEQILYQIKYLWSEMDVKNAKTVQQIKGYCKVNQFKLLVIRNLHKIGQYVKTATNSIFRQKQTNQLDISEKYVHLQFVLIPNQELNIPNLEIALPKSDKTVYMAILQPEFTESPISNIEIEKQILHNDRLKQKRFYVDKQLEASSIVANTIFDNPNNLLIEMCIITIKLDHPFLKTYTSKTNQVLYKIPDFIITIHFKNTNIEQKKLYNLDNFNNFKCGDQNFYYLFFEFGAHQGQDLGEKVQFIDTTLLNEQIITLHEVAIVSDMISVDDNHLIDYSNNQNRNVQNLFNTQINLKEKRNKENLRQNIIENVKSNESKTDLKKKDE